MALVYCDSFEHQDDSRYNNAVAYVSARHGLGVQCGDGVGGGTELKYFTSISDTTMVVGFALKIDAYGGGDCFEFRNSANNIMLLLETTASGWQLSQLGRTFFTYTGSIALSTWYWVEIKMNYHASTGSAELRVNGSTIGTPYSGDTTVSGGQVLDAVLWGGGGGSDVADITIDDHVLMDGTGSYNNDWIGDIWVQHLLPNADSATIELTGSDADQTDNYDLVNEATPSTSDYVGGSTHGHRDLYTINSLSTTASWKIYGGMASGWIGKESGGNAYGRLIVVNPSTGALSAGSIVGLSSSYAIEYHAMDTDPTGSTWTQALFNATYLGFQAFTSTSS